MISIESLLVIYETPLSVKTVMDRIENSLTEKQVRVFARINHAQAAKEVGLSMQDEEVIIFGNPKVGTALMLEVPAIGIELPLKIVAWHDGKNTKVAYQNLAILAVAFGLNMSQPVIKNLENLLEGLVNIALE